ncbi:hypothetical protein K440DRAFT_635266 [Wilcoxina mikolae CBS 423.85]|nr:hypothetical protein K440DRAFT_635266 [Wilcoxina mikolae CBS 423.85]
MLLWWLREWLGKRCHWPRRTPKLIPISPVPKPKEPWEWRELKKQTAVTFSELQKRTAVPKLPKRSAGMLPNRPNRFQAPEWYPKVGRERRVSCSIDVPCSMRRNMWMTGAILGEDEDRTQLDSESDGSTLSRKRRKRRNTHRISFKSKEFELITRPRQEKPWEQPGWIEPTFAPEVEMQDAPPLVLTPEVEKQENAIPEVEQPENTAPSSPTELR